MMRQVRFMHAASGRAVCLASVADTFFTRFVGLQGQRELACDAGMWILPTRGIHTLWMKFAIDAVALDCDMRVLEICENVPPWRIAAFHVKPHSVLELAAGRAHTIGLQECELLRITPQETL